MSCIGPPDRFDFKALGQCGEYITHRPHLGMFPYSIQTWPLYPMSNPAKTITSSTVSFSTVKDLQPNTTTCLCKP